MATSSRSALARAGLSRWSFRVPGIIAPLFVLMCLGAPTAAAQGAEADGSRWLPESRLFHSPVADPLEPGFRGGFVYSDLLDRENFGQERAESFLDRLDHTGTELQAIVGLGRSFPLWERSIGSSSRLQVGVQAGVFARFRMSIPTNDLVATDWIAAIPVEWARREWSAQLRFLHRSAHLGDEFLRATRAQRVGFSHESVQLLSAWAPRPGLRFYGGGTFVARSETRDWMEANGHPVRDRGEFQAGVEVEAPGGGGGSGARLIGSIDWQKAQRTGWQNQVTALAGVKFDMSGRALHLLGRGSAGTSPLGQFFLSRERSLGLELLFFH